MIAPPDHIHISEREADGSWEDCTWDSGLEWYRLCYDARKPATHAEAQLLRRASGEPATGGSNMGDMARGIKVRYGTTIPTPVSGYTALLAALTPGKAAVVQGSMSAFGPTHRLSTWDRSFDGGHAVCVMNIDGALLWCDPEAPTNADVPVIVSANELRSYITAFGGQHVVGAIKNLPLKDAPVDLKTFLPNYTADVKSGSNVRLTPNVAGTKVHATTTTLPVQVIGTVVGSVDPANGSNVWYALWHDNRVEYTAKDNVVNLKAPAPVVVDDGYTKATQDAAVKVQFDIDRALIVELQAEVKQVAELRAALKAFIG